MKQHFYIVDVFAEHPYAGNPLAVVVGEQNLPDETMQLIAAETNYSETTFVNAAPDDEGGYRVRIYTPAREIAFAGHPILGTAWIIRRHVEAGDASGPVRLNLAVGQIAVSFEKDNDGRETIWFEAPPSLPGKFCDSASIAAALGISVADLDERSPVQQFTAGISALIVPVKTLDVLKRCRLNLDAFAPLAAQGFSPLVYVFCRETHHARNDLCVRFFFEAHGVREDPATGNGAAFLGAYLLQHNVLGSNELSLRIEQGHEVRRPSLIMLRAKGSGGRVEVSVGGYVVPVVQGELL